MTGRLEVLRQFWRQVDSHPTFFLMLIVLTRVVTRRILGNIKQKQKHCFSPARLARTHSTGRTHSLVHSSPPTSLFAAQFLDEIHTSACVRRCAHASSWCTRCRPCSSWPRCSCSLLWLWQVVELDPQRPAALLARLSTVECGKLDALVHIVQWCTWRPTHPRRG